MSLVTNIPLDPLLLSELSSVHVLPLYITLYCVTPAIMARLPSTLAYMLQSRGSWSWRAMKEQGNIGN